MGFGGSVQADRHGRNTLFTYSCSEYIVSWLHFGQRLSPCHKCPSQIPSKCFSSAIWGDQLLDVQLFVAIVSQNNHLISQNWIYLNTTTQSSFFLLFSMCKISRHNFRHKSWRDGADCYFYARIREISRPISQWTQKWHKELNSLCHFRLSKFKAVATNIQLNQGSQCPVVPKSRSRNFFQWVVSHLTKKHLVEYWICERYRNTTLVF